MDKKAPIEEHFPVEKVNEIADKESKAKRYYRPVYTMHKWWARRLGCVFRTIILYALADENMKVYRGQQKKATDDFENEDNLIPVDWDGDPETLWDDFYLEDFCFPDKTVLDPFFGGGTTIVEALRAKCNVIGKELNPVAWFVTKKETEPVDLDKLDEAFEKLKEEVAPEIKKYYKTKCPDCGDEADAMYYFWVKELECRNCGKTISLFKDYRVAKNRSLNVEHKHKAICEDCGGVYKPGEKCPNCNHEFQPKNYYHVHCPSCHQIFETPKWKEENTCPHCENQFNPRDGLASGKFFTCGKCGQENNVLEAINEQGKPKERLWAVEYYCRRCDIKGYKVADKMDRALYQDAVEEYKEKKEDLPIPHQEIPDGHSTTVRNPVKDHGYEKFSDMFNSRQLLNLGKLLSKIKRIEDKKVREILLLTFSNSLDYNNMFCLYNNQRNHPEHLFLHHAFIPRVTPTENNIWGSKYGRGTFKKMYKMIKEGVRYGNKPFEKYRDDGSTKEKDMNIGIKPRKKDKILCGDSSYLEIDDKSVDAIITDPPYYDNVMYSELSDFFYVWLREALKERYDHFQSNYTSRSSEIVKNDFQGKDDTDFTNMLANVFRESRKKLDDNGLMVFTFHHDKTDAWGSVLKSVLDSGFFVSAIYPIQAEMSTSLHIQKKGNIEYDMIVVCRKRDENPDKGLWNKLEDQIYLEAKREVNKLKDKGKSLSRGDVFVITIGKCLEIYSKHYPNVIKDGEKVSVQEALETINNIVETQVMGGMFDKLTEDLDIISAAYLSYIVGRGEEISYSSLNKDLKQRNIDISDLLDSQIVNKEGSKIIVPELEELAYNISEKRKNKLNAIDRAYYLIYLQERDKLMEEMRDWATEKALLALEKLGEKENNDDYKELADFVREKTKDKSLEDFD